MISLNTAYKSEDSCHLHMHTHMVPTLNNAIWQNFHRINFTATLLIVKSVKFAYCEKFRVYGKLKAFPGYAWLALAHVSFEEGHS